MLVLSRRKDEKILLQVEGMDDIELTVIRLNHKKVRLGINAGKKVNIVRSELLENRQRSKSSIEITETTTGLRTILAAGHEIVKTP